MLHQQCRIRSKSRILGKMERLASHSIVGSSIPKFILETLSYHEPVTIIDRDVEAIEETMKIGTQRYSIPNLVRPAL